MTAVDDHGQQQTQDNPEMTTARIETSVALTKGGDRLKVATLQFVNTRAGQDLKASLRTCR